MAAHKGPVSSRPRCTWSGSSIAAIPVYQSRISLWKCQHSACITAVPMCKTWQPTTGLWNSIFIHNFWYLISLWHTITAGHRQELAGGGVKKKQKPETYPYLNTCMVWALDYMPTTAKYNPLSSAYMKLYSWLHRGLNSKSKWGWMQVT
jgi:hypothetical protein